MAIEAVKTKAVNINTKLKDPGLSRSKVVLVLVVGSEGPNKTSAQF